MNCFFWRILMVNSIVITVLYLVIALLVDPTFLIALMPMLCLAFSFENHKRDTNEKIKELEERINNCGPWY